MLILPFTKDVSGWSPEEFIERVLVGALHAKAVVVGENFRFGHKAAGHVDTLVAAGAEGRVPGRGPEPGRRRAAVVVDVHPGADRRG